MKLKLSGLGAEPKKIAILVGLLLVAAYFFISNRSSSTTSAAYVAPPQADPPEGGQRASGRQIQRQRPGQGRIGPDKPSLKPKKDEDVDRTKIDPTLHLELLAKLKNVAVEPSSRSLFETGPAGPLVAVVKQPEPQKILPEHPFIGPPKPPPPPPPPPEPVAPPIQLKFFGFVNHNKGPVKRAFFLDGDDIVIAAEGETIKKRYKIIRIGINSAVVEDTQFTGKKNAQQTLPLVAEMEG